MANYDMDDIVEVKRRAKRRKRRIKLIILLAVAAIAGGMYYNRDKWLPKIGGCFYAELRYFQSLHLFSKLLLNTILF